MVRETQRTPLPGLASLGHFVLHAVSAPIPTVAGAAGRTNPRNTRAGRTLPSTVYPKGINSDVSFGIFCSYIHK